VSQPNNIAAVHIGEEDDEEKDDEDESFGADDQHDLDLESMTEQELRAVVKKRLIACINDAEWLDRHGLRACEIAGSTMLTLTNAMLLPLRAQQTSLEVFEIPSNVLTRLKERSASLSGGHPSLDMSLLFLFNNRSNN